MNSDIDTVKPEPATTKLDLEQTEVGSVFVSNYPPYSFWRKEIVPSALEALNSPPVAESTLGLYLHIPFCRKRCKFCYFRVYTDKNSNEIQTYLDALTKEVEFYSRMPAVKDRPLKFVYFGGGTPSYISGKQLDNLVKGLKAAVPWDSAEEITFECEPGTLTQSKLQAIKEIGVTRLSLGVENFNDLILKENGRAHLSKEIYQVWPWIEALKFDQVNIDLIAGMIGETWQSWRDSVQKTIELAPDSVTVYQMELPFNTIYSKELFEGRLGIPAADWKTKREWHNYAFEELSKAGYGSSSAYTMVKDKNSCQFVYRDSVWQGTDMIGTGVASFSHTSGVHFQNVASWDEYIDLINCNQLPLDRAFKTEKQERLTREMILQLKLGQIETQYFKKKFNADILTEFGNSFQKFKQQGFLTFSQSQVKLTRKGLLRVDQLLPEFYEPKYRNSRYT
jgi:oxygen-independent coproporphyrinogen-3 oxidase